MAIRKRKQRFLQEELEVLSDDVVCNKNISLNCLRMLATFEIYILMIDVTNCLNFSYIHVLCFF